MHKLLLFFVDSHLGKEQLLHFFLLVLLFLELLMEVMLISLKGLLKRVQLLRVFHLIMFLLLFQFPLLLIKSLNLPSLVVQVMTVSLFLLLIIIEGLFEGALFLAYESGGDVDLLFLVFQFLLKRLEFVDVLLLHSLQLLLEKHLDLAVLVHVLSLQSIFPLLSQIQGSMFEGLLELNQVLLQSVLLAFHLGRLLRQLTNFLHQLVPLFMDVGNRLLHFVLQLFLFLNLEDQRIVLLLLFLLFIQHRVLLRLNFLQLLLLVFLQHLQLPQTLHLSRLQVHDVSRFLLSFQGDLSLELLQVLLFELDLLSQSLQFLLILEDLFLLSLQHSFLFSLTPIIVVSLDVLEQLLFEVSGARDSISKVLQLQHLGQFLRFQVLGQLSPVVYVFLLDHVIQFLKQPLL